MYQKKSPKSQEPDKSVFTVHHCHSTNIPIEWNTRKDYYRVMSIDPGKKNFCFRIELRNLETNTITTEVFEKIDLIGSQNTDRVTVDFINRNAITILDKYINLILNCHVVIVERQMTINYKMVRFSQHVITYLMVRLRDNSIKTVIIEIDSKLKTKQLRAPKKLGSKETKLWAIEKATELLKNRGDTVSLKVMDKAQKSKKDDLADTIVQIEAVFSYFNLLTTEVSVRANGGTFIPNEAKMSFGATDLYNPKYTTGLTIGSIDSKIKPKELSNIMATQKLDLREVNLSQVNLSQLNDHNNSTINYNLTFNLDNTFNITYPSVTSSSTATQSSTTTNTTLPNISLPNPTPSNPEINYSLNLNDYIDDNNKIKTISIKMDDLL